MATEAEVWADKVAATHVLECRRFGHRWAGTLTVFTLPGGNLARRLVCDRCDMERVDIWRSGERLPHTRRYSRPSGYSRPRDAEGSTRVDGRAVLAALVRRSDVLDPPEDVVALYRQAQAKRRRNR